ELDALRRALEEQIVGVRAPAELDDGVLPADRVRAAVQDVHGGDAAGERTVDADVIRGEHVLDADHRADADGALVDRIGGRVGVRVDDPGGHVHPGGVHDGRAARRLQALADGGDLAVPDQDVAALDRAVGRGEDGGVPDQRDGVVPVRPAVLGHRYGRAGRCGGAVRALAAAGPVRGRAVGNGPAGDGPGGLEDLVHVSVHDDG